MICNKNLQLVSNSGCWSYMCLTNKDAHHHVLTIWGAGVGPSVIYRVLIFYNLNWSFLTSWSKSNKKIYIFWRYFKFLYPSQILLSTNTFQDYGLSIERVHCFWKDDGLVCLCRLYRGISITLRLSHNHLKVPCSCFNLPRGSKKKRIWKFLARNHVRVAGWER